MNATLLAKSAVTRDAKQGCIHSSENEPLAKRNINEINYLGTASPIASLLLCCNVQGFSRNDSKSQPEERLASMAVATPVEILRSMQGRCSPVRTQGRCRITGFSTYLNYPNSHVYRTVHLTKGEP